MKKIISTKIGRLVIMLPVMALWGLIIMLGNILFYAIMFVTDIVQIIAFVFSKEGLTISIIKNMASSNKDTIIESYTMLEQVANKYETFIKTGDTK